MENHDSIDLNGHCFLCLHKFSSDSTGKGHQVIPVLNSGLTSISHLLHYLRLDANAESTSMGSTTEALKFLDTDHLADDDDGKVLISKTVPPMCTVCYSTILNLDVLHEQLTSIRKRLTVQIKEAKAIILLAGDVDKNYVYNGRLQQFKASLVSSDMTLSRMISTMRFVSWLRGKKFCPVTLEVTGVMSSNVPFYNEDAPEENDLDSGDEDMKPDLNEIEWALPLEEDTDGVAVGEQRKSLSGESSPSLVKRKSTRIQKTAVSPTKRKKFTDSSEADDDSEDASSSGSEEDASSNGEEDDEYLPSDNDEGESFKSKPGKTRKQTVLLRSKTGRIQTQLCDVCNGRIRRSFMKKHLQSHVSPEYIYVCPSSNCGLCYITPSRWQRHLKSSPECLEAGHLTVEEAGSLNCNTCEFKTIRPISWKSHLDKHEEEIHDKNFPCPINSCPERFGLKQSVELHLNVHIYRTDPNRKRKQKCPVCPKYVELSSLEKHLRTVHKIEKIYKCRQCPYMYDTWERLMFHKRIHRSRGEGMLCDLCPPARPGEQDKFFDKVLPLIQHYSLHHDLGKEVNVCDGCERIFVTQCQLRAHKTECSKTHPEGKPAEARNKDCDKCGEFFITPGQFKSHKCEKHKQRLKRRKEKTFKCEICVDPPVEFKYEDRLLTHNVIVHGASPHVCEVCQATFNSKASYARHRNNHSKPASKLGPKYICDTCGNKYKSPTQLKDHIAIVHLKEKEPYKCELCEKTFTKKYIVQRHHRIAHLGVKSHVCPTCGLALTSGHGLMVHLRIHTGERPFSCDQCGKTFTQKASFYTHKKIHKGNQDELPGGS